MLWLVKLVPMWSESDENEILEILYFWKDFGPVEWQATNHEKLSLGWN